MNNKNNNTKNNNNINNNIFNFDIINFNEFNHEKRKISEDKDNNKKKKEVLKLLKNIGIDTRFISYTEAGIYINDQRFSKFSKKRQETFKKYYPEMDIISSSIFQKICIRASKVLSEELSPKDKILLLNPKNSNDTLLKIALEPYSRKYGVTIVESEIISTDIDIYFNNQKNTYLDIDGSINIVAKSMTLDEKVEDILSNIFSGNGIGDITTKENNGFKVIYPFINTSNNWIDSFNNYIQENYKNSNNFKNKSNTNNTSINDTNNINNNDNNFKSNSTKNENIKNYENKNETSTKIAESFMEFLDNIIPQYKENFLKSSIFIEDYLENNTKN